jgi:hypothetical protein
MDRKKTKSNLSSGMLIGTGAAAIFAFTFFFATLYLAA